jgi:para-nitrobenzyl esterase
MKASRRDFIQSLGLGSASLSLGHYNSYSKDSKSISLDDQQLFVGDNIAVANTQYGKVRGFILRGIHTFLGIPYGADTSGSNRFMPPQKPNPWT